MRIIKSKTFKALLLLVTPSVCFAQFDLTGPSESFTGDYQINITADCNPNSPGTYYLYENNSLVRSQYCWYQTTDTFNATGKSTGTYNYRLDYCDIWACLSEWGAEPTHTVNVSLEGPPPPTSTCVITNNPAYTTVVYYMYAGTVIERDIKVNWNVIRSEDSNGPCQMEVINYIAQGVAAGRVPEIQNISDGGLRSRLLIPKGTYLPDCDPNNPNRRPYYCPINTTNSVALGVINYKATNAVGTVGAAGGWYAYFVNY